MATGKESPAGVAGAQRMRVVGRERELAELRELLDAVAQGRAAVCLVTGEPGIGKTSLATAFAAEVRGAASVLWGASWAAGTAPAYWPWRQALRGLLDRPDAGALRDALGPAAGHAALVLPELDPAAACADGSEPEPSRFAVFDAISALLGAAARGGPLVIVLDDLHDADAPSIALLEFLARALTAAPVLFLGTAREREAALRDDIATPLARIGPDTRHLPLAGLTPEDVGALVAQSAAHRADDGYVESLVERTNGNPLFVGELLRLDGRGAGDAAQALPASLRDTIRRRVSPLPQDTVDLLGVGAVIGLRFPLGVLAEATERDAWEVLAALEPALALGIVEESPHAGDLRLRFPHALVRDTLYEGLPARRRAELHGAVGEVLERRLGTASPPPLSELAHHFAGAAPLAGPRRARDYAARAGAHAMAVSAWEEAIRRYAAALELHAEGPADDEALCELLLGLGSAQVRSGDVESARATLVRAAEVARGLGASDRFAAAVLELGAVGLPPGGSDAEVIALLEEAAVLTADAPPAIRARVAARLAVQLYWSGDPERIAALVAEARALAASLDDPAAKLDVLTQVHLATSGPETPERLADIDRLIALATVLGDAEHEIQVRIWRVAALLQLDRLRDTAAEIETVAHLSHRVQQPRWEWYVPLLRGLRALAEGRLDDAERLREDAGAIGLQVHGSMAPQLLGALLVATRWTERQLADLLAPVTALVDASPDVPAWRCVLVATLVDAGRHDEARVELRRMTTGGRVALRTDTTFLSSATLLADAAARLGEAEAARALYEALGPYAGHNATLPSGAFNGPVDRHLGVAAATFGDVALARRHLAAARESAERGSMRAILAMLDEDEAALGAPRRDAAPPAAAGLAQGPAEGLLRRDGDVWTVAVGDRRVQLHHAKGLSYLAELVARPGVEVHATELAGARLSAADDGALGDGDLGPVLDDEAKDAYRRRAQELREEIDEADAFHDPERAARAREELDLLAGELSRAVGLGGRDRRPGSTAEKARVNVTRAIRSVLRRMAEHDEALAQELVTTVATGAFCSYRPDPRRPVRWRVEGS